MLSEAAIAPDSHAGSQLPAGVRTGTMTRMQLGEPLRCQGIVDVPPGYHATVHAPIKAFVESLNVLPGSRVRKGQSLAVLAHPDLIRLQESYLEAKAERSFQNLAWQRRSQLDSGQAVAGQLLDRTRADLDQAEAHYRSLHQQLVLAGLNPDGLTAENIRTNVVLRAPISGYVSCVYLNKGALADEQNPLLELVDDSHRHLELTVFAADLARVAEGQSVRYRIPGSPEAYAAEIHLINAQMDKQTKGVQMHAHLKDPAPVMAIGSLVEASILMDQDSVWAVPQGALGGSAANPLLWVLVDGKPEAHAVQTGRRMDSWVEIVEPGSLVGATIVVDGSARMGAENEAREHGH